MKLTHSLPILMLCAAPQFATAQQTKATSPEAFSAFVVDLCMFNQTEDIPAELAVAQQKATASGLPTVVENADMGMYGQSDAIFIMVSKTIDTLACVVELPAAQGGDHAFFEVVEAYFDAAYDSRYPDHLESIDDNPSPHIDGHDWIIRTDANDSAVVTISFGTEDGISISGVLAKKYD